MTRSRKTWSGSSGNCSSDLSVSPRGRRKSAVPSTSTSSSSFSMQPPEAKSPGGCRGFNKKPGLSTGCSELTNTDCYGYAKARKLILAWTGRSFHDNYEQGRKLPDVAMRRSGIPGLVSLVRCDAHLRCLARTRSTALIQPITDLARVLGRAMRIKKPTHGGQGELRRNIKSGGYRTGSTTRCRRSAA